MNKRFVALALVAACTTHAPVTHALLDEPGAPREENEVAPAASGSDLKPSPASDGDGMAALVTGGDDKAAPATPTGGRRAAPPTSVPALMRVKAARDSLAVAGAGGGDFARVAAPRAQMLQAGSSDDNLQFNAFLQFLAKHGQLGLPTDPSDRVVVEVRDARGLPIFGAKVNDKVTYPDGRAIVSRNGGQIRVSFADAHVTLPAEGPRLRSVTLDTRRKEIAGRVPLDIAFVLDTTGSMQDEIEQLKRTLDVIQQQLSQLDPATDLRVGLVEYKDRGDEFVTRPIAFTSDIAKFRDAIAHLKAYGGGDEPEDVQAGLEQALHALQWRDGSAVKIAFLIGDAPPHLDYREQYTYLNAAQEASRRGIKIAAVGCSGLNLQGEVVWREIAQATLAPFVFLTRGERGDMEGTASTVSHHVGSNWVAENLEKIVLRMVKGELEPLQPRAVARESDWFDARKGTKLSELFRQSVQQLVDYSVEPLDAHAAMKVSPLQVKSPALAQAAVRLDQELRGAVNARDDAPLAIEGQLANDDAGRPELFVKLKRIATGEMLSVSLIKLDPSLVQ